MSLYQQQVMKDRVLLAEKLSSLVPQKKRHREDSPGDDERKRARLEQSLTEQSQPDKLGTAPEKSTKSKPAKHGSNVLDSREDRRIKLQATLEVVFAKRRLKRQNQAPAKPTKILYNKAGKVVQSKFDFIVPRVPEPARQNYRALLIKMKDMDQENVKKTPQPETQHAATIQKSLRRNVRAMPGF